MSKTSDRINIHQLRAYARKLSGNYSIDFCECETALINMGARRFITSKKFWDVSCIDTPFDYYVYVIVDKDNELAKIGYSKNPVKRLKSMSTSNPFNLEIKCLFEGKGEVFKQKLQYDFKDYNKKGEWFRIEGELKEFISKHEIANEAYY